MATTTVRVRVGEVDIDVETSPVAGTEPTSRVSRAAEGVVDAFGEARQAIVEIAGSMAELLDRTAPGGGAPTTSRWPSASRCPPRAT